MTPVDVTFPDVDQIVPSIGTFQTMDVIWRSAFPSIEGFYDNLKATTNRIQARFTDLITIVQNAYSASLLLVPMLLPDDYDPPNYKGTSDLATSPEEEVALFQDKRDVSLNL